MNLAAYFKVSYGLYIISSKDGNKLNGYIANTAFQVTAEPAQFAIACNKNNFTHNMISKSKVFAVSILERETNSETIGVFGYKSGNDIDKFSNIPYKLGKTGSPVVLKDTIAWFEFEVTNTVDVGTHTLFIGTVVDCDILKESAEPLTYDYYHKVKKGVSPKNAPTYIDPEKLNPKSEIEKHTCMTCGYIYNPEIGDILSNIPAGTSFEKLPHNWHCPICGVGKEDFRKE